MSNYNLDLSHTLSSCVITFQNVVRRLLAHTQQFAYDLLLQLFIKSVSQELLMVLNHLCARLPRLFKSLACACVFPSCHIEHHSQLPLQTSSQWSQLIVHKWLDKHVKCLTWDILAFQCLAIFRIQCWLSLRIQTMLKQCSIHTRASLMCLGISSRCHHHENSLIKADRGHFYIHYSSGMLCGHDHQL